MQKRKGESLMIQAYLDFWKRYFDFSGTTSRKNYWLFVLADIILGFIAYLIVVLGGAGAVLATKMSDKDFTMTGLPVISAIVILIVFIYLIATIIPRIAIGVRRLRSAGFSAWLIIFMFVINIVFFILSLFPNKVGEGAE